MPIFYPTMSIERVYQITPDLLKQLGVTALLLDVDNTLTTHGNPMPDENIMQWLEQMKHAGVPMMILSNNTHARVEPFAKRLGLAFESSAAKPFIHGFQRCCERLNVARDKAAIVGDQIFTDIAGANLCGLKSILVEPIQVETGILFVIKRVLERPFLKAYQRHSNQ